MTCTEDARHAVGSGALRAVCLVLPLALATSCQLVFGLDDYELLGAACPEAPTSPGPTGVGICGIRQIGSLSSDVKEVAPGAICEDGKYFVYFQRLLPATASDPARDGLMCAACDAQFNCEEPAIIATDVINPYVRRAEPPEIWVSTGSGIVYAPLKGCSPIPSWTAVGGVVNTGNETYPAVSPGGTVLYFNRCEDFDGTSCNMRIHVATRSQPGGPFDEEHVVDSLVEDPKVDDLRAQPFWRDERAEALLFSSNRAGDWDKIDDLDVFVAHAQPSPVDPVDGFGGIEVVPDFANANKVDYAPWPFSNKQWLASYDVTGDPDLYVVDVGCGAGTELDAGF